MPLRSREGMWHYRFWLDGHEYTANTALAATERNKINAARVEAKARELVMTGRAHELKLQVKPFSEAAAEFLTWADGEYVEHPNSARRLRTSFVSLTDFFRKAPVSSILRGHVNDFKAWRRTEHEVREITIRHDLHALSKAFGYFVDHNWARENPVKGVEIPSDKDAVRMHVLAAAEEAIYFERAARRFPDLHDLGRLMINQGCRPEEFLSLPVANIDLVRSRITIGEGKSLAARRILRLTIESREICARRIAASSSKASSSKASSSKASSSEASSSKALSSKWLFPGKRRGLPLTKLNGPHSKVLDDLATCQCGHAKHQHATKGKCVCGCAEFDEVSRVGFVPYDFRHTFATRAAEAGMPIATLAAILGHADLRSVMKYIHVRQEAQDRAMDQFDEGQNKIDQKCSSGFRPVDSSENRENGGTAGTLREGLTDRKIN
jgi:integrase